MVANIKLSEKQCPAAEQAAVMAAEQRWFRSIIASFIYLVLWTRPDMAYAVSKLCKFMHNPGHDHIIALKRLLRYLLATANYGLIYDFSPSAASTKKTGFYGYYDASHADCPDTMKSTLAYLFFFEGCAISWNSKLHTVITTSTNHSEYCAAAKAVKEAKSIEKVAIEVGMSRYVHPIDLFSDSRGCIAMTYNLTLCSGRPPSILTWRTTTLESSRSWVRSNHYLLRRHQGHDGGPADQASGPGRFLAPR